MNVMLYDVNTGASALGSVEPHEVQIGAFLLSGSSMNGRPYNRLFRVLSVLSNETGGFPTLFVEEHHVERTGNSLDQGWVCINIARILRDERQKAQSQ